MRSQVWGNIMIIVKCLCVLALPLFHHDNASDRNVCYVRVYVHHQRYYMRRAAWFWRKIAIQRINWSKNGKEKNGKTSIRGIVSFGTLSPFRFRLMEMKSHMNERASNTSQRIRNVAAAANFYLLRLPLMHWLGYSSRPFNGDYRLRIGRYGIWMANDCEKWFSNLLWGYSVRYSLRK